MNEKLKELLTKESEKKWNREADEHNQWDSISQEEKEELILAEKRRAELRRKLVKKNR